MVTPIGIPTLSDNSLGRWGRVKEAYRRGSAVVLVLISRWEIKDKDSGQLLGMKDLDAAQLVASLEILQ